MLWGENKWEARIFWRKICAGGGLAFVAFLLLLKFGIFYPPTHSPFPRGRKVIIHLVSCEFLLLLSYVFNVSQTFATLKVVLSVFLIHKVVTGLCVMPSQFHLAFLQRSWPPSNPSKPGRSFVEHSRQKRREEFNCGKKQSSPDSETKASHFLKISGKKERGLGEALAIFSWQGGCSRLEAERGKPAGTVKLEGMAKGFWLIKQKFNLALLWGVRQNNGSFLEL